MASGNSYFNLTLFKKTITRFWPLWVMYLAIWLIVPMSLSGQLDNGAKPLEIAEQILGIGNVMGTIMSLIFCGLTAMAGFSFLYGAKNAGAYASLPVKRECLFFTAFFAGLACLTAADIVIFLAQLAVEAAFGAVEFAYLLQFLAMRVANNLFFYGFASLCAMLTGNLFTMPVVYAVLNFTVIVVEYIVRALLSLFVFGMRSYGMKLAFLSPAAYLLSDTRVYSNGGYSYMAATDTVVYEPPTELYYTGWTAMLIYAAVGIALAAVALLLFKRRRMETAGDVVAINPLKPVFKYCLAAGTALVLGALLFELVYNGPTAGTLDEVAIIAVFMLIGGFIGYFVAEMLMKKSLRVFRGRTWMGYGIFAVAMTALVLACEFNLFGMETNIPDASELEAVEIYGAGDRIRLEQPENIQAVLDLNRSIVENKSAHESAVKNAEGTAWIYIDYYKKNGSVQSFTYYIAANAELMEPGTDAYAYQELVNTDEAVAFRKSTDIPITSSNIVYANISAMQPDGIYTTLDLTTEEAMELYYDCILPDIADGTLGRLWIVNTEEYYDTVYRCTINIEVSERDMADSNYRYSYSYSYFYTNPTVDSWRTNAWLEAHGVEMITEREANAVEYERASAYYIY